MPTYLYKCPVHKEFEYQHSIKEKLEFCPICEEQDMPLQEVIRLIAGGTNFVLSGGGWASEGYAGRK